MIKYINKKIISVVVSLVFLIVSLFASNSIFAKENNKDLVVYFLDVGQGDSALIKTPNGLKVMIDAGKGGEVLSELDKVLPFYDRKIDVVIFSHGDMDHIGGFFEILDRYKVGEIIRSNTEVTAKYEQDLLDKANKRGVRIQELGVRDDLILDQTDGIYLRTFYPESNKVSSDENLKSLVLKLVYGENSFLFTGDATFDVEDKVISEFLNELKSSVLKVAHHGSRYSTSDLFLDKVAPQYAILSYGENSYGHPSQEVLDRLNKRGIQVFQTKVRATIVARTDGKNLNVSYLKDLLNQPSFFQGYIRTILINSFYPSR